MKRALALLFITVIILGLAGCAKKLTGTTISGVIKENGQIPGDDFPGAVITLTKGGQIKGEQIKIAPGATKWSFAGVEPGVYEVVGETPRGSRATLSVDTINGSSKGLVLNFQAAVLLSGTVQEQGKTPGVDWPGGCLTVKNSFGNVVDQKDIKAGLGEYEFSLQPGKYVVFAESLGRKIQSAVVDLSSGRKGSFALDFQESMLFGEFLGASGVAPACLVQILEGNEIVKTQNIPEGQGFYQIALAKGGYQLKVLSEYSSLAGKQGWKVRGLGGYELNRAFTIDQSLRFDIPFDLTIQATVTVSEAGLPLSQEFPGGKIEIYNGDKLVNSKPLLAGVSEYGFNLLPGKYIAIADSFGRQASVAIDLSHSEVLAGCSVNFEQVVLHGRFLSEVNPEISNITVRLKNGDQVVGTKSYCNGEEDYWFAVVPNTAWTLETDIPELGFLKRSAISVGQSTASDVDLEEKICINGRITENDLMPIPGEFPGGKVRLITKDGIARSECNMGIDGTFEVFAPPNVYRVEADSETRIQAIEKDCTERSASDTVINYTDIVVFGNIAMRDGGVPSTFPETDIEFLAGSESAAKVSVPPQTASFKAIVPNGDYSLKLTLKGTKVVINQPAEGYKRSCKKIIFIDSHVARIMGNISTTLGTPEGQTSVSIYRADNGALVQTKKYDPGALYEFYLNPNNYNIVVSNPNYVKLSKKAVTAFGDIFVNFCFTHAPITFKLELPRESYFWGSYSSMSQYSDASNLFQLFYDPTNPHDHIYTVIPSIELGRTLYVFFVIEDEVPDPDKEYIAERKEYVFTKAATLTPF